MLRGGEVLLPAKLNFKDYDNEFKIRANMSSSFYFVSCYAGHYGGRDNFMDFCLYAF